VQGLEAGGSPAELGDASDLCRKSARETSTACAAMTLALMKGNTVPEIDLRSPF
jgi:hypothetical protein